MFTDVHRITHQELLEAMIERVLLLEGNSSSYLKKTGNLMANKSRKFQLWKIYEL